MTARTAFANVSLTVDNDCMTAETEQPLIQQTGVLRAFAGSPAFRSIGLFLSSLSLAGCGSIFGTEEEPYNREIFTSDPRLAQEIGVPAGESVGHWTDCEFISVPRETNADLIDGVVDGLPVVEACVSIVHVPNTNSNQSAAYATIRPVRSAEGLTFEGVRLRYSQENHEKPADEYFVDGSRGTKWTVDLGDAGTRTSMLTEPNKCDSSSSDLAVEATLSIAETAAPEAPPRLYQLDQPSTYCKVRSTANELF